MIRKVLNCNLLRFRMASETQLAATARAAWQGVLKGLIDLLGWEQSAFVFGMTGLTAALALVLARRRGRRRRLDDVRGRRLGGSRGVLASGGKLLLKVSYRRLQLLQLEGQVLHLGLQTLAAGTAVRCCFRHALVLLSACCIGERRP